MKNFVVKTIANAAALAVAVWLLKGITLSGETTVGKVVTLFVVALVFGAVNFVVKPIVKLLSFPLFILTLGLITLVINALMLLLTSWIADRLDLAFHVGGFWPALVGGVIISIVAWAMHVILPDEQD
ncbi:membrane protein [Streptomyces eurocidicus]|uniref:Membrane protein n=1 Tax=Streptomyces eurocidicus TaxID=66423 RepID=A0A2N8NY32_STREU|nr:phage holin family protein [Streptomyces eurocidicus]MBB5119799.1 putative membrane protein [Streptomyces eurocidicus]MBF6050818.1 phage holin family protein [Streptomyces eurocidicus]PNE33682.1 membrane protein [Streptomyces eurocidicus]